jgi:hypothetical protein
MRNINSFLRAQAIIHKWSMILMEAGMYQQQLGIGGSKSVTVSTGSSRQSGGASNQELSTSAIVRAASTNGDGLRASPVSLPTTSPGGNDEANSPAAWTARSGESSSDEGTAGVCIGTKRELCTAICVKLN